QVHAVDPVDGHAVAMGDEADDLVAWHRGTAPGQPDPYVRRAVDLDARVPGRPRGRRLGRQRGLGQFLLRAVDAADRLDQLLDHGLGADPALPDCRVPRGTVGVTQYAGQGEQAVGGGDPGQRPALLAHG